MQVKCKRCNHEWDYKGTALWITCPSCRKLQRNGDTFKRGTDNVKV